MGTKFIRLDVGSRCRFLGCHEFHLEVLWGPCIIGKDMENKSPMVI